MARYTYETTVVYGDIEEASYTELDVKVSFSVAWGDANSGHYGPPEKYDPGSADVVEDIVLLTIEGKPKPWNILGLHDADLERSIVEELSHHEMLLSASEEEGYRLDQEADYRNDMRQEQAWGDRP